MVMRNKLTNISNKTSRSAPNTSSAAYFQDMIKTGNWIQAFGAVFGEFFSNSTIHGVKYFSELRRHWTERIWWMISFALSVYLCQSMMKNVWVKWNEDPVIVTFNEKSIPVSGIPFPAVTICPGTKSQINKLNFTDVYHMLNIPEANISEERLVRMKAAFQICDLHLVDSFKLEQNYTDDTIFNIIEDIALPLNSTISTCKWRNQKYNCAELYRPVMTEEGLCYTFNALNSKDIYTKKMTPKFMIVKDNPNVTRWDPESGYNDDDELNDLDEYPYRVISAGPRVGLHTTFQLYEHDLDYICRGPVHGFKILLHSPIEEPQISTYYFRLPIMQDISVSVKPQIITTSIGLRHYKPNERQCFFNSERKLRFFNVYTQRNCELECLANFTLNECGCVKFSMPRDENIPICGASKISCFERAQYNLIEKEFNDSLDNAEGISTDCNCLLGCTSIDYNAEIGQTKYNETYSTQIGAPNKIQPVRLTVFFREHQFIALKRSELYGEIDFLANCGGLLGLFFGASVLSIMEIFYYFTLRLGFSLRIRILEHESHTNNTVNIISEDSLNIESTEPY